MHHRDGSWLTNSLKHSQGTNRIEHPPTSIAHHRSFCWFLTWHYFGFCWLRLTQGRVDTQDLVRVQTRVWAGQNHNAGSSASHCRSHLHQPWGSLISLRELTEMVSVFAVTLCVCMIYLLRTSISARGPVTILKSLRKYLLVEKLDVNIVDGSRYFGSRWWRYTNLGNELSSLYTEKIIALLM
jgi:hypothetical protein